jgi:hypothetical protein
MVQRPNELLPGRRPPVRVRVAAGQAHLPHGRTAPFSTPDDAAAIDRINSDYDIMRERQLKTARGTSPHRIPAEAAGGRVLMSQPLRIAHIAPVATTIPPPNRARWFMTRC